MRVRAWLLLGCTAVALVIMGGLEAGTGAAIVMAVVLGGLVALIVWGRMTQAGHERELAEQRALKDRSA